MIDNKDSIIIDVCTRNLSLGYYFYDLRFKWKMDTIDSIVR